MISNSVGRFLRDERGSYTIWSVIWFMAYVAVGGLALDVTDAYRHQSLLQSTADAAALAGVMSLHNGNAVSMAETYAKANMEQNVHGTVLRPSDVKIGRWDFDQRRFVEGAIDPNAVYVTTRRMEQNYNPVAWNFLRILSLMGLDAWWDIQAEAVAAEGVDKCHNEGLIAGEELLFNPHTNFFNYICLIGVQGIDVASQGNSLPGFDDTVYAGVGCKSSDDCVGPGSNPWNNPEFLNAFDYEPGNYNDQTEPDNAKNVGTFIDTLLTWSQSDYSSFDAEGDDDSFVKTMKGEQNVDYSGWEYLVDDGSGTLMPQPDYESLTAQEFSALEPDEDLKENTVYEITNCSQGQTFTLPAKDYDRVGIVTDCRIGFSSGSYTITNSLIATRDTSTHAVSDNNSVDVTFGTGCDNGDEIYSMGDVRLTAGADVAGTRILAEGDVHFAAKANGDAGVHIEATGNIDPASGSNSQSNWGLCEGTGGGGPVVLSYGLVQ